MLFTTLPLLLNTRSDNDTVLVQQNVENIERLYAYLQTLAFEGELVADGVLELGDRLFTDSDTITWDSTTPGQIAAHVVPVHPDDLMWSGVRRVIASGQALVLRDTYNIIVSRYFTVHGTLELQGDAVLEVL